MNTREREVMDVLAARLRSPVRRYYLPDPDADAEALAAYDALLAEGSASSEGAEAVAWREIQPDGRPVDEHGRYYPVPAPAGWVIESISKRGGRVEYVYSRPQPAQGEQCSALEVFRIAGGDVECTPNPTAAVAMDCLRDLRECYDEALSEANRRESRRSSEGSELEQCLSERRPIAESDVSRACEVFDAATFYSIGGYTFDDYRKRMRAALESAHPRGLPAGSDAELPLDNLMASVAAQYPIAAIVRAIDLAAPGFAASYMRLATAEQPSCGQDARDAWQPIETAPDDDLVLVCEQSREPVVAHIIAGKWTLYVPGTPMLFQPALAFMPTHWMPLPKALAAIAAQQRQGGGA